MKQKKLVSIIIPTHNRQELLKRSISYFKSEDFNFCSIIIIDSSAKPLNLKLEKNFKYIHYKKNKFASKISYALSKVVTKYCVLVNDDDFISLNGLTKGINFLELNKDYVSYHGEYISFRYLDKINQVIYLAAYDDTLKNDLEFSSDDKIKRVKKLYLNRPHWYNALHYTKNLKKSFQIASLGKDIHFSEILIPFIVGLAGKLKVVKVFWYAKDANVYTDIKIRQETARIKMAKELFVKNSIIKKKLIEMIKTYKIKGSSQQYSSIIESIFKPYFKKYLFENKKNINQSNMTNTIRKYLPIFLKNLIRITINYISNRNVEDMNNNLRKYGPSRNNSSLQDWTYMKKIIKNFINFKDKYKNIT